MRRKVAQILVLISTLLLIVTGCGAATAADAEKIETPAITERETAESEEAVPEATVPEEAEEATPEEVKPEEAAPEEIVPEEVMPEEAAPGEIVSEETAPEEAAPEEITPEEEPAPSYTYMDLAMTMYAKSSVNVRDLPSTDGNKVGGLSTNEEVTVTGQCNETGWYRILYKDTVAYVSNNYIVEEKVVVQTTQASVDNSGHNYYKHLTDEQAAEADAVAKQIADTILADSAYTTDLERVNAAAQVVAAYSSQCVYGSDQAKWYRSPYGVFVGGVYTCAGSTRALGRVLDFMGFSWQHANENQNSHQWCVLTMDGQTGYADGMGGFAGYGEMASGMTLPDGRIIIFY